MNLLRALLVGGISILFSVSCSLLPEALTKPGIALIYSVEDYAGSTDVAGANLDQANMSARFNKEGWTVLSRSNNQATSVNLASDLEAILGLIEPYQRVVFYFSGHGAADGSFPWLHEEALVLYDGIDAGQGYHELGFLVPSRMKELISPLLKKKAQVVLILDSCYSGGFVGEYIYDDDLSVNEGLGSNQTENPQGWGFFQAIQSYFGTGAGGGPGLGAENLWVLSAAGPREESFGSDKGGIFTNYFLEAAKGAADANGDKVLTIMELYKTSSLNIEKYFNIQDSFFDGEDYTFLPHLSGNYTDLLLFTEF